MKPKFQLQELVNLGQLELKIETLDLRRGIWPSCS